MPSPLLAVPLFLALLAGVAAACLPRRTATWLGAATALVCLFIYLPLSWQLPADGWRAGFWSVPALGMSGGLKLDGLSAIFTLLITGIGALIFTYTSAYLGHDQRSRRLVVILLFFMLAMLGAVTANDVILLFIFWELTSLTSFFLVGYDHERREARRAALQALLVTAAGGLALLAGLLMLVNAAGTTSLSGLIESRATLLQAPGATAAMVLILLGCFTKSAQLPFHFWLPSAMAAPTPVSAYLHSATMVKLGIYLIARLSPLYGGVGLWHGLLVGFGVATALMAMLLALRARDLKRILAYTTVAALGTLCVLLGLGTPLAVLAALTFLVVHAFYKAALFMVAGIVDHSTGLRDITRLYGLRHAMPRTAIAAWLAALSMAGLPPFLGFVGKELIYDAVTTAPQYALTASLGLFLVNVLTVTVAAIFTLRLFFGPQPNTPETPHDPPIAMLAGPLVLGSLGLLAALALGVTGARWLEPAAAAVLGRPSEITLGLWHGFNAIFMLSLVTVMAGLSVYVVWRPFSNWLQRQRFIDRLGATRGYDACLRGLTQLALASTQFFQHGSLGGYLRLLFTMVAAALLLPLFLRGGFTLPAWELHWLDIRYLVFILLATGAIAAMRAHTAFVAVMAVGLVGVGTALVFMLFGAPDVAFTQFSVETLMAVIIATTLARIPIPQHDRRPRRQKTRDAILAGVVGLAVTATLLTLLATPLDTRLSDWFGEYSLLAAHGRNVVNVILVDFRALDTLGEITVLAIAAFGVVALLRSNSGNGSNGDGSANGHGNANSNANGSRSGGSNAADAGAVQENR